MEERENNETANFMKTTSVCLIFLTFLSVLLIFFINSNQDHPIKEKWTDIINQVSNEDTIDILTEAKDFKINLVDEYKDYKFYIIDSREHKAIIGSKYIYLLLKNNFICGYIIKNYKIKSGLLVEYHGAEKIKELLGE